ncbi:hypothetical protein GCM10007886_30230 [Methylobacterium gregans]|nr:hypothetical protein GCM10007886_30230 [Methylobacterium gregans]
MLDGSMASYLIQILLPLSNNGGAPFPGADFKRVRSELTDQFGGMTAFTRGPAEGVWEDGGEITHDNIIVFEVMADELDVRWWSDYRQMLEVRFRQESIVIRSLQTRLL